MKAGLHARSAAGLKNFLTRATMKRLILTLAATAFAAAPSSAGSYAPARTAAPAAQCRTTDRAITRKVSFARGRTTAVIKDTVRLCTSHEWVLRARGGQTMSVHLAAGKRTSFTVQSPSGTIEDADGVKDWSGELPETGDYLIIVGTDATAAYTLEVTIR
jgi:Ni/Co efflux regulator RcnB